MNAWRHRTLTALALALGLSVVLSVPAMAKPSFVTDLTQASESAKLLAPGFSSTRTVEIHNRFHGNAELYLQVANLVDDDNGCVEPETESGDTTCGAEDGELSPWLQLSIRTVPRDGAAVELWAGNLTDLVEDDVLLLHRLPKDSTNVLELVTTMSMKADNSTMTDRVAYDLEWTMVQGIGKQVNVLGTESGTNEPTGPSLTLASAARSLRDAQTPVLLLLGIAALLVPRRLLRSRH